MTAGTLLSDGTEPPVVVVPSDVKAAGEEPILTEEELARLPRSPLGDFWTILDHPEAWVPKMSRQELAQVESFTSGTQE